MLHVLLFPVLPAAAQPLYPEVSEGTPLYEIYDMERLDSSRLVMTGMYSRMVSGPLRRHSYPCTARRQ